MGVFYEEIPDSLREWILEQKMLCVGTSPLSKSGHVNLSPKGGQGGEYFGVVDSKTFWYLDLSGSGNETISHLYENGRITIMFNAFEGPPKIVRLWGIGEVLEHGSDEFNTFVEDNKIKLIPGVRSIIVNHIHQVGSSCGFSVPYYDFKDFRPILNDLWENREKKFKEGKTEHSMDRYWAWKNAWSVDGLPGMKRGLITGKKEKIEPLKKMVGRMAVTNGARYREGIPLAHVLLVAVLAFVLGLVMANYSNEIRQKLPLQQWDAELGVVRNLLNINGTAV